ncbi:MAG TPA: helix-turn-helix domain-containing protein [Acidimicrobiales bacterium]|jgi:AcrR family transcriptional regulator|nr:helix-turn-helix domain-containing protein [Acidimicrobiales bacterium]
MRPSVKGVPGGNSRRDQARATRRRIIAAAHTLFVDRGYGGTTLEEVAAQAHVSVQSVYFHFGNKATLLKEALDVASVGDDEPVPLLERPWVRELESGTDAHRVLTAWLANSRAIYERVAGLLRVVRDAAGSDPSMAQQWAVNQQQRLEAFRHLARTLARTDRLRPGVSSAQAADLIFAMLSPEVFELLVSERRWSPRAWETRMVTVLEAALLEPDLPPG